MQPERLLVILFTSAVGWSCKRPVLFLLLHLILPPMLAAQQPAGGAADALPRLLPGVRHFEGFRADALEPRNGAGFVVTDLLSRRGPERPPWELARSTGAREVQAVAVLGATMPLLELARWDGGGVVIAAQAGVVGRFRIELPSRDDLGQDWFMAAPVEVAHGDWSGRARISHRSSHLGDEFVEETGGERIEFGGEALDVHAARRLGGARVYAGGSWIFRSYTRWVPALLLEGVQDRYLLQAGADGAWPMPGTRRGGIVAGIDVQASERTGWRRQAAVVAGARLAGERHALQLVLRAHDGPSALGQFFLTQERAWSLEFVAEF